MINEKECCDLWKQEGARLFLYLTNHVLLYFFRWKSSPFNLQVRKRIAKASVQTVQLFLSPIKGMFSLFFKKKSRTFTRDLA